jgi:AbrB family looped-hinge helix DNA binding protein
MKVCISGSFAMAKASVTTVQERGQITIPVEIRRHLGLEKGDMIAFVVTEAGVLLKPQQAIDAEEFARLGQLLREKGIDIEALKGKGTESELLRRLEHTMQPHEGTQNEKELQ